MLNFKVPTIYMSHSIFGTNGKFEENCERAIKVANRIRRLFPEIGVYCPAESEIVLWTLREMEVLEVDNILKADCTILRACHGWMWIYTGDSKGCEEELEAALFEGFWSWEDKQKPVIETDLLKANYGEVRRLLTPIVEDAKERYKTR